MTKEEAIAKGYLENRIVYLKPSPRKGKMVTEVNHIAYFMYEGASINFVLPYENNRKVLVNPFKDSEERKFFEQELAVDLNPYKTQENFWFKFRVTFTKSPISMNEGLKLDLSDPLDNLRYRVVKCNDIVAPSWEQRTDKPSYKFALVDEHYEEEKASSDLKIYEEMFTFYGSIKNSTKKMKDFLNVYILETKQLKDIPEEADSKFLQREIKNVMDTDKNGFLRVAHDKDYDIKLFINKAVKAGAIDKHGVNSFSIPGIGTKWGLLEMVNYLKVLKKNTDDTYLRIEAQIQMAGV